MRPIEYQSTWCDIFTYPYIFTSQLTHSITAITFRKYSVYSCQTITLFSRQLLYNTISTRWKLTCIGTSVIINCITIITYLSCSVTQKSISTRWRLTQESTTIIVVGITIITYLSLIHESITTQTRSRLDRL